MKKLLVMISIAALVSFVSASTALAALKTITTTAVAVGSTPFSCSTNVTLLTDGDAGGYNVGSKHLSGDKSFASSSISATIEEFSATKGVAISAIPALTATTQIYTGSMGGY